MNQDSNLTAGLSGIFAKASVSFAAEAASATDPAQAHRLNSFSDGCNAISIAVRSFRAGMASAPQPVAVPDPVAEVIPQSPVDEIKHPGLRAAMEELGAVNAEGEVLRTEAEAIKARLAANQERFHASFAKARALLEALRAEAAADVERVEI